jgi:hypothetical protein
MGKVDYLTLIENELHKFQVLNIQLMFKCIRFLIWLLINGIFFSIGVFGFMTAYNVLGFEKTLIIILLAMLFGNIREHFYRA